MFNRHEKPRGERLTLHLAGSQVIGQRQHHSRTYPQTPLVLLSSLAQGADQLAVEAALEHKELKDHLWVRAPLPCELRPRPQRGPARGRL
jgi:hypothetical protein